MEYNLNYIKKIFGIELPEYINYDYLFNIAFCLNDNEIKLYVISEEKYFLYKCSQNGNISKQYDASKMNVNINRLEKFLKYSPDFKDLIIDTIEDSVYYIYCEESSYEQIVRLLERTIKIYDIDQKEFFNAVSYLNQIEIDCFSDLFDRHAVSMLKISLSDKNFKVYSRPFHNGNNFTIPDKIRDILTNIYDCNYDNLLNKIENLWVSYNFNNLRTTLSTQNDNLKEKILSAVCTS